jgi:hypothetical protein
MQANLAIPGGSARRSCASAVVENAAVAMNVRNNDFIFPSPQAPFTSGADLFYRKQFVGRLVQPFLRACRIKMPYEFPGSFVDILAL